METSYRIIADVPTSSPGLGFADYVEAISDALRQGEPAQFTVGLYGKWGSGKSSLLKAIRKNLDSHDDVISVEFDAWRYQRTQQIVIPLLHAVLESVRKTADASLIESTKRLVRAFGMSFSFRIPVVGGDTSIADIKKAWDEAGDASIGLDDAFARPYDELKRVGTSLDGRRIVILIDDLDRCTAENMVLVLESINVITDVAGFVFVLALDYDVLVQAVEYRYPSANGHQFIEKIVQLPFRIPRAEAATTFDLTEVVPSFDSMTHLQTFRDELLPIIDVAFEGNPRSAKRYINAVTLLMKILTTRGVEFDASLLAFVLAGELRWPDDFQDIRTAVAAGDDDPLAALRGTEDAQMRAFAELRSGRVTSEALGPILRLTSAIAAIEPEDVETAREVRPGTIAANLPELLAGLEALGYVKSPRSERVFTHPAATDQRIVLGKRVARFEVRSGLPGQRPWSLDVSFSLATEVRAALDKAAQQAAPL